MKTISTQGVEREWIKKKYRNLVSGDQKDMFGLLVIVIVCLVLKYLLLG